MKKGFLFLFMLFTLSFLSAQNVGIGTTSPDSSAILDLSSSEGGFLMPRMTMAGIEAIVNPATGLQVYNTEDHCVYSFDGSAWRANCSFRSENALPVSDLVWNDAIGMPGFHREKAVSFVLNGKAYVGTGTRTDGGGSGLLSDFYKFNPSTNSWSSIASFPKPLSGAVAYVYEGEAYVATGDEFSSNSPTDKFYKYDPVGDAWTPYGVMFPYRLSGAVCYVLNGVPHICGGVFPGGGANDEHFYFDSLANKFLFKADYPETNLIGAVAFTINNIAYVGLGNNSNKFYAYDPAMDTWSPIANYPVSNRDGAVAFELGGKGYVGTGSNQNDFYRYDPGTDTWTMAGEIPDLPGIGRSHAVSFVFGGQAYVGTGPLNTFYQIGFPGFVQSINSLGDLEWISVDPDSTNEYQDLQEVLALGNDAGGYQIHNLGYPVSINDAASKAYTDSRTLMNVLSAGNSAGNTRIQSLGAPVSAQDAATKSYVDNAVSSTSDQDPTNEIQNISNVLSQALGLNPGDANGQSLLNLNTLSIGTGTPIGKVTIQGDQKNVLTIKSGDNLLSNGIAFQNTGSSYTWSVFRKDIGGNQAKLVFSGGLNSSLDALTPVFTLKPDGHVGMGIDTPRTNLEIFAPEPEVRIVDSRNFTGASGINLGGFSWYFYGGFGAAPIYNGRIGGIHMESTNAQTFPDPRMEFQT